MKLSEVLKNSWPIKSDVDLSWLGGEKKEITEIQRQQSVWNTALTSCDREIDREALAKDIKASRSMYRWEIRDKQIGDDIQDEDEFIATSIISTMPTWLKRSEDK